MTSRVHAMPFGAAVSADSATFRLWAPAAQRIDLRLDDGNGTARTVRMSPERGGWYAVQVETRPGALYRFIVDGETPVPDPASRFQPQDVHGPSEVIDPAAFAWDDAAWPGRPWHETVLYELHVGAFTPEGTFAAAAARLDYLAELGITAIELMPLGDCPGGRNWGYDGVLPFAPEHRYGRPDDLKRFICAAHTRGLMVFLDVVYNHFGPEGNYLHRYAPQFFTDRYKTPWGCAIDFDGPHSRAVRDFFIHNALYWIEEFHVDGLRLDAVHAIRDARRPDILMELAAAVQRAAPGRHVHLVLENDDNAARYLERGSEGIPKAYAAQWNDDVHHALHVLIAGETFAYYQDYECAPLAHLGRALAEGFAYQGEASRYRRRRRGERSAHLPPTAFVSFLQNHDQVGNRAMGDRIGAVVPGDAARAAAAIVLLSPSPPLLFMGEEWNSSRPFPFFCEFEPGLANAVRDGRRREFAHFPEFRDERERARIPDPLAPSTFESAKLDWDATARSPHKEWLAFYRDLLAIRCREIVPLLAGLARGEATHCVHTGKVLEVQWRLANGVCLQLIATMSPERAACAGVTPLGRLIFSTHPDTTGATQLPPWFVAFHSDAAERG